MFRFRRFKKSGKGRYRAKMVRNILCCLLIFTAAGATPAMADPISILVTAIAAAVHLITVSQLLIGLALMAVTAGLGFLEKALSGNAKNSDASNAIQGVNGQIQTGGAVPRSFIVGQYATAGSLVYANTWGTVAKTPNAYLVEVIALQDLPSDSLTGLYVNDAVCTYGSGSAGTMGYAIPEFNDGTNDYLWVKFLDGTQVAADSYLTSTFGSDPDFPYASTRVGTGITYAICTARINNNLFSGFPRFKFVLKGAKLYDQRADSTAGGSGAQRYATASTWAWTENPVVIANHILRGIEYSGDWFWGLQNMDVSRVPSSSWFTAMNEADSAISKTGGGTEVQYRMGGEIKVDLKPADVLPQIMQACNARIIEVSGYYKILCGAVNSSVLTFDDSSIIIDQEQDFDQFPSQAQLVNTLTSTYPEPTQAWEQIDAPQRQDATSVTADGQEFAQQVDYPLVPFLEQVQRLQTSTLLEGRKFRRHTFVLPPEAQILEPCDVVTYSSVKNGYTSKLFRVDSATDFDTLDVQVVLVECDPADYNWTSSTNYIAPANDGNLSIVGTAPPSQSLGSFTVTAQNISGANSTARAAIKLTWAVDVDDVDAVLFQVRLTSGGTFIASGEIFNWQNGFTYISENILPNTQYDVRAQYLSNSGREFTWTSWTTVTTSNTLLGANDLGNAILTYAKFASTITPVQLSTSGLAGSFSDVTGTEGAQSVDTNTGKVYAYHSGAWAPIGASSFSDLSGTIGVGQFSTTIRPIEIVTTLPSSGNFNGRTVFLTTDHKIYRYNSTTSLYTAYVDGTDITANSITAGQISAGAIGTNQLSANAVTASKVFIGDTSNMIMDGNIQDLAAWHSYQATATSFSFNNTGGIQYGSANRIVFTPVSSVAHGVESLDAQAIIGDSYFLSANVAQDGTRTGNISLYAVFYDITGTAFNSTLIANTTTAGSVVNLSGTVVAPASTATIRLLIYSPGTSVTGSGNIYFGGPTVRLMYNGSLIVDGSITANEMAANSIVAGAIAAGAINASSIIVSNIIVTGHIVDNSVSEAQIATLSGSYNTTSTVASIGVSVGVSMPSGNGFCLVQVIGGTLVKNTSNPSANLTFGVYYDSNATGVSGINGPPGSGAASSTAVFIPATGSHTFYIMAADNVGGGGWTFSGSWKLSVTQFVK